VTLHVFNGAEQQDAKSFTLSSILITIDPSTSHSVDFMCGMKVLAFIIVQYLCAARIIYISKNRKLIVTVAIHILNAFRLVILSIQFVDKESFLKTHKQFDARNEIPFEYVNLQ
jgi:hypothetical protein